jgi:hypothetical protein
VLQPLTARRRESGSDWALTAAACITAVAGAGNRPKNTSGAPGGGVSGGVSRAWGGPLGAIYYIYYIATKKILYTIILYTISPQPWACVVTNRSAWRAFTKRPRSASSRTARPRALSQNARGLRRAGGIYYILYILYETI